MLTRVWDRIHEPRFVTIVQTIIYVSFAIAGYTFLTFTPPGSMMEIPTILGVWWSIMLASGGTLGFFSAPFGVKWLERPAIVLCVTGGIVYLIAIFAQPLQSVNNIGSRVGVICWVVTSTGGCVIRWWKIRRGNYDIERV